MNRRAFLSGLIAAPAVIRVAPLMRIAPVPLYFGGHMLSIVDLADETRKFMSSTPLPEAAWRAATDAMNYGTGAVEMFEPGMFRHVPVHELPSPLS